MFQTLSITRRQFSWRMSIRLLTSFQLDAGRGPMKIPEMCSTVSSCKFSSCYLRHRRCTTDISAFNTIVNYVYTKNVNILLWIFLPYCSPNGANTLLTKFKGSLHFFPQRHMLNSFLFSSGCKQKGQTCFKCLSRQGTNVPDLF